jgi:hypothetical protein
MNSRSIRDFSVPTDIWPTVEKWAENENFRLVGRTGDSRRYEKSDGSLLTVLEINQTGQKIHLEAWLRAGIVSRLLTLWRLQEESGLASSEHRAIVPRTVARDSVNRLMVKLAQPLIT